jgi:thiol-disulfide isomerase/thioredoxin/uncharacterized membrane protein YphA (DoxX/SURF4 family)
VGNSNGSRYRTNPDSVRFLVTTEMTNPDKRAISISRFKTWVPVILSTIVGLVLLVSGLQKSFEIDLFIRQIRDYQIIANPLLIILGAWCLITFECCLGAALAVNFQPKIAVPLGSLLFLIFMAATGWAWHTGATNDCGCFGSWIERTPKEAMLEDVVLFCFLMIAWKWNRSFRKWPHFMKEFLVAIAFLLGLSLPLIVGPVIDRITSALTGPAKEGFENFVLNFPEKDLSVGKHIIFIMATDCPHCRAEMENLNKIAEDKELPDVIAFVMNNKEQCDEFIFEFEPAFKIYQIKDDDYWRLLGDGEIPRTILINDGLVIKKWDLTPPDIDTLKAAAGM